MSAPHPVLDERQTMILTHLTTKVLQDASYLAKALKDLPAALKGLGADDKDITAIGNYVKHLSSTVKDNNNVGFW